MKGKVRTENKCPRCGKKFQETLQGLKCVKCKTTPDKYYVDFWWMGERIRVFLDKDGNPFTSYEAAKRFFTVMRAEVDAGKFNPKDYIRIELRGLQFANYAMAWVERRKKEIDLNLISREYLRAVTSHIKNHMNPFFGNRSVRDIHEGLIEDFMLQLPTHLKPKSVYNIMGVLHKIFKAANKRHDILRMPEFPEVKVGQPEVKWLEEGDQEKVLAEIACPVRRAFFVFMFEAACRPSEARALKWKRVLLEMEKVVIAAGFDQGVYKDRTKEGDVRILPMSPKMYEALTSLTPGEPDDFVFTYRDKPFSHTLVQETWRRARTAAGVDANLYQGTRHSAASQAASAGVPMEVIGAYLGHKCASSTRRYAHLHPSTLAQFRNRQQTVSKAKNDRPKLLKIQDNNK